MSALEEDRDFLLRSLDDLEREHAAGDVDDVDYAELKDDYTALAANVLRALDQRRALAATTAPRRSWVRTAAGLGLVAVLALGVGWFAFRDAGVRAPGEGVSGDARQDSANLVLQAREQTGQAGVALQDGDTDQALDLYRQAMESYSNALDISPNNVDALTNRGWLYYRLSTSVEEGPEAQQLRDFAGQDLDQAIASDPEFTDARIFRAIIASDRGDFAAAQADLDAADSADIPTFMTDRVDQLRAEVTAGLAATTGSTPATP